MHHAAMSPESCPALVLNADYRPLSYYPLSLWCWQDAVKAVFLDRVDIVSEYDRVVRSPSFEFRLQGFQAIGASSSQHDRCTGLAEATGEMRAQSRRGAGDQGCLAAKVEWLWVSHFTVS